MSTRALAGAAALLLTTAPAWALTPDELWGDWQETLSGLGVEIEATEAREGDALVLTDLTVTYGAGGTSSETVYERVDLRPDGDDVLIALPDEMTVVSRSTVDGETVEQVGTLSQSGQPMRVSETGDVRRYDWRADTLSYAFAQAGSEGDGAPVDLRVTMSGLQSVQDFTETAAGASDFASTMAMQEVTFEIVSDAAPERFALRYVTTDVTGEGSGTLDPNGASGGNPLAGIDMTATNRHGGATTTVDGVGEEGPYTVRATSRAGTLDIAIDEDGLTETFGSEGLEVEAQVAQFPVPVTASLGSFGLGFTAPLGASDETKPLGLRLALAELVLDDLIWSLFDPTGQLPRDPASLTLDVSGEALMRVDLLDPEALAALTGAPGEMKSLTLTELALDAVGVDLDASGELTFPTPDVTAPVGAIEITLDGAFALADRLVALGVLPAEQVAFVRGMSGMVATQVGDDQLESTITFTEGGGISANGLPLR